MAYVNERGTLVIEGYLSRKIVPILKRAGFSAYKCLERTGFSVTSVRGGEPYVTHRGEYDDATRREMLDKYEAAVNAAGYETKRYGDTMFVVKEPMREAPQAQEGR